MKRIVAVSVVCGAVLSGSVWISSRQAQVITQTVPHGDAVTAPGAADRAYYGHLFHHIAYLKKKAEDNERQGKDWTALRTLYRRQIELSDSESRTLDEIASDCVKAVERLDAKAKRIIDQFRSRFPKGRIPKGERLPPPPPQLEAMQAERNQINLRARDRLMTAVGRETFTRVDGYVKRTITINGEPRTGSPATSSASAQLLKQRAASLGVNR